MKLTKRERNLRNALEKILFKNAGWDQQREYFLVHANWLSLISKNLLNDLKAKKGAK